jgi:hypothetical protein
LKKLKKQNLKNYFSSVSTADDVKRLNPIQNFISDCRRLHMKPNEIIVLRFSNGVRAPRGGMFCNAILINHMQYGFITSESDFLVF